MSREVCVHNIETDHQCVYCEVEALAKHAVQMNINYDWESIAADQAMTIAMLTIERDKLRQHNVLLIEAINRLHEVAMGEWDGSQSEIADLVNTALAGEK